MKYIRSRGGAKLSFVLEVVQFVLIALLFVIPIRAYVAQPFMVSGQSMYPTFHDKEYLIVDELSYHFHAPARGDVIVFRYPKRPSDFFIKRVIGLPGEIIIVQDGTVTIKQNPDDPGIVLKEPYINNIEGINATETMGKDEYFVLGDNRGASSDSRFWGAVPKNLIVGRTLLRLLPLSRVSFLPGRETTLPN